LLIAAGHIVATLPVRQFMIRKKGSKFYVCSLFLGLITMLLQRKQSRSLMLAGKAGKVYISAETPSLSSMPVLPKII